MSFPPAPAKAGLILAAAAGLCLLCGCAFTNEKNRRVLNAMDGVVRPGSTAARIALAPAAVPAGTAALAADIAVVHPACVIPDAAGDVYDFYWKPRDIDWLRKTLLFPVIVVLTPPTFVGDWLLRAFFDVPPRDEEGEDE